MTTAEIATKIIVELIRKSGVRAWETDLETRQAIAQAALDMASVLGAEGVAKMSKILLDEFDGTPAQITFADATDFFGGSPTAANDLRHGSAADVECNIDLTGLANAAGRQSNKVDLGAIRAPAYGVRAAFEIAATPTAGAVISLYWAPSASGTAGTGNPGAVVGADGAYAGYSSNLTASLKQLDFIGNFICTAQASTTVQIGEAGVLVPKERYGTLIVVNNSGAALHSDAAEINIVFDPVYLEAQ